MTMMLPNNVTIWMLDRIMVSSAGDGYRFWYTPPLQPPWWGCQMKSTKRATERLLWPKSRRFLRPQPASLIITIYRIKRDKVWQKASETHLLLSFELNWLWCRRLSWIQLAKKVHSLALPSTKSTWLGIAWHCLALLGRFTLPCLRDLKILQLMQILALQWSIQESGDRLTTDSSCSCCLPFGTTFGTIKIKIQKQKHPKGATCLLILLGNQAWGWSVNTSEMPPCYLRISPCHNLGTSQPKRL